MKVNPVHRIIDLSHPLSTETPSFPGDLPIEITVLDSTDQPSDDGTRHLNCSRLEITVHCGTHLDAPFHFFQTSRPLIKCRLTRASDRQYWSVSRTTVAVRSSSVRHSNAGLISYGGHPVWC